MKTVFGQTVFTVEKTPYFWEDVVLAASAWGDWAVLERDVHRGVACLRRAVTEGAPPTRDELDAATAAFRYERDLISAKDARDWLDCWSLSIDDWMDYMRRAVLRERWRDQLSTFDLPFPAVDAEVDARVLSEAVFSGELGRAARKLAEHAACHKVPGALGDDGGAPLAEAFVRQHDSAVGAASRLGLSRGRAIERLFVLDAVERSYASFRARVVTARAVEEEIRAHELQWMRVDCESLSFADDSAAREALLCMRADGKTIREVAAAARRVLRDRRFYLDDVDSKVGERLLAAGENEVIGPLTLQEEFVVLRVMHKLMPLNDDPEIHRRAEVELLRRLATHQLPHRIQWVSRL